MRKPVGKKERSNPRRTRVIAFLVAALLLTTIDAAWTSDITVSVTIAPNVAAVGNEVTLVVTVEGKFRKSASPELPPLEDFSVYETGTSQRFSFGTGGSKSTLEYTYVLVPKKPGKYTIEPIRFRAGDKVYTAAPVVLEVLPSTAPPPTPTDSQPGEELEGDDRPIFIRARTDRDTVYVNQQITWTLGFYTDGRLNLVRTPEYSPPQAEGFWVEDLPPQKNYYRQIDGRQYLVNEIKRGFFATAPGEFRIGAARVDLMIDDFGRRSRGDIFDDFFRGRFNAFGFGKPVSLKTDEIAITVLPLPEAGRPADFSGLVGRGLNVTLRTDKNVAQVGEPINLTVEITGVGNFKTMTAPEIPQPTGFKMYESGSTSDLFKKDYVVSGRKKYEYVLIPKVEGDKTLPPVKMAYFDPIAKSYRTIQSSSIQVEIMPGTEEEGRRIVFAGSGDEIEVLGKDINFIHPVPAVVEVSARRGFPKTIFIALHALPLLALLASFAVERRRRRWLGDVPLARATRASRDAEKRLNGARRLSGLEDLTAVYAAISAAVRGYFADKMNASAPGLTMESIEQFLAAKKVDNDTVEQLRSVLRACDNAQYAPGAGGERDAKEVRDTVDRARVALRTVEKRYLS
ncbi:MAG: protein BatD [Candidatus Latescibacterota bacterium]|nr:MAG: protein BatD [Candidatus Latescibacterota bacterium]